MPEHGAEAIGRVAGKAGSSVDPVEVLAEVVAGYAAGGGAKSTVDGVGKALVAAVKSAQQQDDLIHIRFHIVKK